MKAFASLSLSKAPALLVGIVILAALTRFLFINSVPVSLYWDEVSEGYNSYSILHTGKDEWGREFPLLFRAFDDDKMPANIYLSTVPIALFGLNEFSVRFTSGLSGVLSVVFTYLVIRELFSYFKKPKEGRLIGLISAFLLAITPWHIIFSRTGFEANVAFCFSIVGTYLLIRGLVSSKYFYFAFLVFAINFYLYRSSVVFVPAFLLSFIGIFSNELKTQTLRKPFVISFVLAIVLISPLLINWAQHGDVRTQQVDVFDNTTETVSKAADARIKAGDSAVAKIIYNRRIIYVENIVGNYVSHFSPRYLFFAGDGNPRHSVKDRGLLYAWELPFIVIGLWFIHKKNRKVFLVLCGWLLAAPIPASLSVPSPHALRSLPMVMPLTIFCAGGMYWLYLVMREKYKIGFLAILLMLGVSVYGFISFIPAYAYHNTVTAAPDWGDGYKQLVMKVNSLQGQYDKVIITGHYWQPYAYFLFYGKYDPLLFQTTGSKTNFSKYIFGGTDWDKRVGRPELDHVDLAKLAGTRNILVALSPQEYLSQKNNLIKLDEVKDHRNITIFILSRLK